MALWWLRSMYKKTYQNIIFEQERYWKHGITFTVYKDKNNGKRCWINVTKGNWGMK